MKDRVLGLDLVRFLSFLAITTHHVSWVYFYTVEIPVAPDSAIVRAYEFYARLLAFSGFTVLFQTMALTAMSDRAEERKTRFLWYLLGAWALFTALIQWESEVWLPWDIYPLIFVGLLIVRGAERIRPWAVSALGALGLLLLWIPFWNVPALVELPLWLRQAVIGDCKADVAEWAVLPWIGLVFLGYAVGARLKDAGVRGAKLPLRTKEGLAWAALLLTSVPWLGAYFYTPLGSQFSCYVYRQSPHVLWSHLVWPIFFMRASFDPSVQGWLSRRVWAKWIASLQISRRFWLAYLIHYPLAFLIAVVARNLGAPQSRYHPSWVALVAVFYLPLIEYCCRILIDLVPRFVKLPPSRA